MNQVIDKLSEIEVAATRILEGAAVQKKELERQYESKTAQYDRELERVTAQKIAGIQKRLGAELEAELSRVRNEAQHVLDEMERYYLSNHEALSREICEKIIRK